MKKHISLYLVLALILIVTSSSNCGGDDPKIKYENGFFADSTINLYGLNSEYDDLNMALPQITMYLPVIFSSNRNSGGNDFDLVTGVFSYIFNQIDGSFELYSEMLSSDFYDYLENAANTDGNDFGPSRIFNGLDGKEYFFCASESSEGDLDLRYMNYYPSGGNNPPTGVTMSDLSVLNTPANEAYLTFDREFSKVYYTTDRNGDYDIYENPVEISTSFEAWLASDYSDGTRTDSINSTANDKCPYIFDNIMVFASDRPGGMGGYDLYMSVYANGKWSSARNMGPDINTQYNEYRPLLSFAPGFTNDYILFSSDRPGGKGGYDLYLRGLDELP